MNTEVKPWYDDAKQIAAILESKDVAGLHEVIKARSDAAYVKIDEERSEKKAVLDTFVVNATWWLDTYGQVGVIRNLCHSYDYRRPVDPKIIAALPMVMSETDFIAALPKNTTYERTFGGSQTVPPAEHTCEFCNKGWTLLNSNTCHVDYVSSMLSGRLNVGRPLKEMRERLESSKIKHYIMGNDAVVKHPRWIDTTLVEGCNGLQKNAMGLARFKKEREWDVVIDRDNYIIQPGDEISFTIKTYYHPDCREIDLTERFLDLCEEAFKQANVPITGKLPIKNAYGSAFYRGNWWLFTTPTRVIRIGWRKRVIECQVMKREEGEYSDVKFVADGSYKHVDNYDELREHLIELHLPESLKIPVV